ncbi:MAG: triose-phosphate isomerase [Rhodobacteraceae bacterium]|jgi:triosephosphate isomerase|uniref:Triosephosphate isomerase n=1 Tax=Salipiger profundus TaxID=1229727 RepID=A0A1U7DAX6_9RHOB|nr:MULTISPECIES: triose-phosphate isomerase [Salipiger]APX25205.1 triosephosphate isomerase [Salipiger profundus]MAB05543.1 triose-phosphate isomerase [Paracoccaceae bacterium]GGA16079.1 triosephosphate isomerase [Salipiger profundus]SFD08216.1 triosephosphate isomerase [Salipiger profundus]
MRKKLAAGNWKMNGLSEALSELSGMEEAAKGDAEVLICPPATLVAAAAGAASGIAIGGQDCHAAASGAHTGDISATMLKDVGASYVILGHSERRTDHDEHDEDVRAKCAAAWEAGLSVVLCVGESLDEREASNTLDIIGGQLAGSIPDGATGHNLVVAYEPIWAIGTGKVPTNDQIGEVHDFMRARLEKRFGEGVGRSVRLLYGGSVKPGNASEIFAVSNVDGALVGGASLKASDFVPIIEALNG